MPAWIRNGAALLALFLLASGAWATGSIAGSVYALDTMQPLAAVTVTLESGCLKPGYYCTYRQDVATGFDGAFLANDLPPDTYFVSAYYPPGGGNYLYASQQAIVADGAATSLAFYLVPGATISGHVTRESDGVGIGNARLVLVSAADPNDYLGSASADASGAFRFEQVAAGSYTVRTDTGSPYQDQYYAAHPLTPPSQGTQPADDLTVAAGQELSGIDFQLVEGGRISGVATDRYTGQPIASGTQLQFVVYDADSPNNGGWLFLNTLIGEQGKYEITGTPDAPFLVGAQVYANDYSYVMLGCPSDPCTDLTKATSFNVPSGTALANVNFSTFPGSVITGYVRRSSDNAPIPGATVTAFNTAFGQSAVATTTTNSRGYYALTGGVQNSYIEVTNAFLDGTAYISQDYSGHDCVDGKCAALSGNQVAAPLYQVTNGINFLLHAGAAISGKVVSSADGAGILANIVLFQSNGTRATLFTSDSSGTFSTSGLQSGKYYLEAYYYDPYGGGEDCQIFSGKPCSPTSQVVGLGNPISVWSNVTGIDFMLVTDRLFEGRFE